MDATSIPVATSNRRFCWGFPGPMVVTTFQKNAMHASQKYLVAARATHKEDEPDGTGQKLELKSIKSIRNEKVVVKGFIGTQLVDSHNRESVNLFGGVKTENQTGKILQRVIGSCLAGKNLRQKEICGNN